MFDIIESFCIGLSFETFSVLLSIFLIPIINLEVSMSMRNFCSCHFVVLRQLFFGSILERVEYLIS